jgi:XcyI restriction endonuclease
MTSSNRREAWLLDQLSKSEFFHQKLHEWGMLDIASQIEEVKGETLPWECNNLGISQKAWNKVIHCGIKPVIVFAHPQVLRSVSCAVGYYRMLAMVSQKSMNQIGLSIIRYEQGKSFPDELVAENIAQHLNKIISHLVETDEQIDAREFDLWRGMAAGSQAQGSWQNAKGSKVEILIKSIVQLRLREENWISNEIGDSDEKVMQLKDGRRIVFASEPDIGVYKDELILVAVEIKGGIDTAGVLERFGATLKSLIRAKEANSESTTILILPGVSVTTRAISALNASQNVVNYWFILEELVEENSKKQELFELLAI